MPLSSRGASDQGGLLRRCLGELGGLALPSSCGGCGSPGRPWCDSCDADLRASAAGWPRPVRPDPAPPGCPRVWASGPYDGPLRGALVAFKDGDRRDLVRVLAPRLASALTAVIERDAVLTAALREGRRVWLVPVPSSRKSMRARGDVPLNMLLSKAIRQLWNCDERTRTFASKDVARCLRQTRRVADQAGLDSAQRSVNLERAMAVPAGWGPCLGESVCVLVDDVLTTGATLTEGARALREAGAWQVVGATVAATQRRRGHPFG